MPLNANFTDDGVTISISAAHAKGGGGGGGGGDGGDGGEGGQGGGGQSGGQGGGGAEAAGAPGNGHGNGAENGVGPGAGRDHGATASGLGRGNAAHANEHALSNAAPNSQVGKVAAYRDVVEAIDAAAVAEADLPALQSDLNAALDAQTGLPADATDSQKADAQQAVDNAQAAVDAAVADIEAGVVAEKNEPAALEAAVKDPTEESAAALAGLLGPD